MATDVASHTDQQWIVTTKEITKRSWYYSKMPFAIAILIKPFVATSLLKASNLSGFQFNYC